MLRPHNLMQKKHLNFSTHEVLNQPSPLEDYNLFETDQILQEAFQREAGKKSEKELKELGSLIGSKKVIDFSFKANENPPILKTHDRFGNRIDEVEYHPAYHGLMKISIENKLQSEPWIEKENGHTIRTAKYFIVSQNETGHLCPVTMSFAVVPTLRKNLKLAKAWEPKILSNHYDPRFLPMKEKNGVICGMAMTEKQGGSDVRANTSRAVPLQSASEEYLLTGHKWFCSAPMSDGFMVLAQAENGLTCFFMPRWTPDEKRNNFFIQRLKNKLGNRSNASSEIEFNNAFAWRVGEEGCGVPTIIEMVNHTRLDCVIGSTSWMRQALVQAIYHCSHRKAFGKLLINQPLMQNVLADLAIESEASTVLMMRLARAFDERYKNEEKDAFRRLSTAASKYWICKRAYIFVGESLECLGGAGYVEESILPRLYRETPLNSIWEGSGNVNCLDVLRAIHKQPKALEAVLAEIQLCQGSYKVLDLAVKKLESDFFKIEEIELQSRRLIEQLVIVLQASLLVRFSPDYVAEAFIQSRLEGNWGKVFGTLSSKTNFNKILQRSLPI